MKATIRKTDTERMNYETGELLELNTIEVNTIDDLIKIIKDNKAEIILGFTDNVLSIEIYNDYRE